MENHDASSEIIEMKIVLNPQDPKETPRGIVVNQPQEECLDIIGLATICFNQWNEINIGNGARIELNHILILLDAIGIKKNEYEMKNLIDVLRQSPSINFNIQDDDKYDLNDFMEIVKGIREDKSYIEEKFLVEAFSRMDEKNEGVLDKETLKKFARKALPKITDDEIDDMIQYFNKDDKEMTYENFFKLYHEG